MRVLELFCGTKSVGKAFEAIGAEVVSLDSNPKTCPAICANILTWDYHQFRPGHFDVVWASPVCQHYSIARTTGGPRDLVSADALVLKTLEIIEYFHPKFWGLENPQTGLLKTRVFMQDIPFQDVCYCRYGFKYRKCTRIWGNIPFAARPLCTKRDPCESVVDGKHLEHAQRFSAKARSPPSHHSQNELYAIPPALCQSLAEACAARCDALGSV
jgi:C-5 cytosine-specific DNA methylase